MNNINLSRFTTPIRAVVIGASGGIGSAFVELLAECDQVEHVHAFARSDVTFAHANVTCGHIDITDEATIEAAANMVNDINLVICATGVLHDGGIIAPEKSLRDLGYERLMQSYAINTVGPALVAKHFLPLLPRDNPSCFAALSARVGSISDNALGGWYAYRASKAALNMMLKNAAIELARKNKQATVLSLHPGTVDTGLSKPFQGHVSHDIFTPQQSATYLLNVIGARGAEDTGLAFDWNNEQIRF